MKRRYVVVDTKEYESPSRFKVSVQEDMSATNMHDHGMIPFAFFDETEWYSTLGSVQKRFDGTKCKVLYIGCN